MKEQPISAYDCLNAKYPTTGDYIYCKAGHKLGGGHILKHQVDKGKPLIFRVCQLCKDIIPMD